MVPGILTTEKTGMANNLQVCLSQIGSLGSLKPFLNARGARNTVFI